MSLLVLCFSSELGKFPLKGYWKWEVLYTILFPLFIAALCFMILQVYLAYFDVGSESVEVNVVEVDVVEVDVSELGATEVVNVSEVNFVGVSEEEVATPEEVAAPVEEVAVAPEDVAAVVEVDVSEFGVTEVVDVSEVVFAEMDGWMVTG